MAESIESQFWKITKVHPAPLNIDIEIVDTLPETIFKNATTLLCWAFKCNENNLPVLCGFPIDGPGNITKTISKMYAVVNEHGIIQELGGHDATKSFKLPIRLAAMRLFYLLEILKQDGNEYYHMNEIQFIVDDIIDNKGDYISCLKN